MSNIFYIADTHFRHRNIIEYAPERGPFTCVEEHDEFLISNWNNVVTKRDTVYLLGDVAFGSRKHLPDTVGRLNGRIRLVAGNHDHRNIKNLAAYCEIMAGCVPHTIIDGAHRFETILTHIPVHPSQQGRFHFNIHGHLHMNEVMLPKDYAFAKPEKDPFYVCVSAEHTMMCPMSRSDLVDVLSARKRRMNISEGRHIDNLP